MKRLANGRALFYHRDSEGRSDLAPQEYVSWAIGEANKLNVRFDGSPARILEMIDRGQSNSGDIFLDFAISGNILIRSGFEALRARALSDQGISHIFIPRRDRLARPDNPIDGVLMECELRQSGLTIVYQNKIAEPINLGSRLDVADLLSMVLDFNYSGEFRMELARKLISAKVTLASLGFSFGGEPPYGFRRWLCKEDGQKVRELVRSEHVKMVGHHVVWLPTAESELEVVRRIGALILTRRAGRIAKMLNSEGIPSPNAGRTYRRNGVVLTVSGLWTTGTIRNMATSPVYASLMEYGKRCSGDQMRFSQNGPRALDDRDFHASGRLKTIVNPESERQLTPIPSNPEPIFDPGHRELILATVAERGKFLKGKPRSAVGVPNALGGRVFDMNCGWPMYRYNRRQKFCYTCGLYQNSESQCCEHNTVDGLKVTQLVLGAVRQKLAASGTLEKLKVRLRQLACAEQGSDSRDELRRSLANCLAKTDAQLKVATRNMTLAPDDQVRSDMMVAYRELKAEQSRLKAEMANVPPPSKARDPEADVQAALEVLQLLFVQASDSKVDHGRLAELFDRMDARLYLKFRVAMNGKRKLNVPAGGVLTFGTSPPPVPLYVGPVDRPIIKKMIAAGESVSPLLGKRSAEGSKTQPDAGWSAKAQRVTRRYT
jgi:hypothetical protein